MKAAIGEKHQVVIKIVKQLDDLMVRDPEVPREASRRSSDELDIPMPSSCLLEESIICSTTYPLVVEEEKPSSEDFNYVPSLSDLCLHQISKGLVRLSSPVTLSSP